MCGFDNGLYVGTEEKRIIKNDFWAFCWNHQTTGSAKLREGEMAGGVGFKVWVWGDIRTAPEKMGLGSGSTFYT